jgi:hypothetical protein
LEVYDNTLRKRTGSYYTPPEGRLRDGAARSTRRCAARFSSGRPGLASPDVTVGRPGGRDRHVPLGVLRQIAQTVADDQGPGAVREAIEAAAKRVIGFELQFGPFAVAQLRLIAEMQALMTHGGKPFLRIPELRLFITDTLGNPFVEEEPGCRSQAAGGAVAARRQCGEEGAADHGGDRQPPYKGKADKRGGWIESASKGQGAPLDRWRPPRDWGVGATQSI